MSAVTMLLVGTQPLGSQHPPHTPAATAGNKPPGKQGRAECVETEPPEMTEVSRFQSDAGGIWRRIDVLVFRLCGGEGKKRWEYFAGVPSLSAFLNPPTLRPSLSLSLSLSVPRQLYQTAALAVFLFD